MRKWLVWSSCSMMVLLCCSVQSATTLGTINKKIGLAKENLHVFTARRQKIERSLESVELKRSRLELKVGKTRKQLSKQRRNLRKLRRKQQQLQRTLSLQQKDFNAQLQASYVLYRQPAIKLLLDQKNSAEVDRMVTYHGYINAQISKRMKDIKLSLLLLSKNKRKQLNQLKTVENLHRTRFKQLKKLRQQQLQRRDVVSNLNAKIRTQRQRLRLYRSNKKDLDLTLKRLRHLSGGLGFRHFSRLKGRLVWPVKGKVDRMFGRSIEHSQLRWAGTLIQAPSGKNVEAVAPGAVVYAKWLAGYGLLVIINHGEGYMSLYGRNQNIFVKVGQRVKKGDVVSTVGNTGGFHQSALYFALRHRSKPLNPMRWCR